MTVSMTGSSSRYRPGNPMVSVPNPRLAVITSGDGVCAAAARNACAISAVVGTDGTTSR